MAEGLKPDERQLLLCDLFCGESEDGSAPMMLHTHNGVQFSRTKSQKETGLQSCFSQSQSSTPIRNPKLLQPLCSSLKMDNKRLKAEPEDGESRSRPQQNHQDPGGRREGAAVSMWKHNTLRTKRLALRSSENTTATLGVWSYTVC